MHVVVMAWNFSLSSLNSVSHGSNKNRTTVMATVFVYHASDREGRMFADVLRRVDQGGEIQFLPTGCLPPPTFRHSGKHPESRWTHHPPSSA